MYLYLNNNKYNIILYSQCPTRTTQLNLGGKIIDNDKEIATNFNNFFANVEVNTESLIPKVPNITPSKFLKNRNQLNFVIAHVSNEEIIEIICSLKNKSSGLSSIPLKMLSIIPDLIILPLAHIINMSLLTGVYPDLLKIAKIIPIHKGSSTQDINNYRPISLLSIFDKIIEKLIHKRLYSIDNGNKYGCGIFIDLRKAFDTVNHDILLNKLEHYGIRDSMLDWFRSYLKDRKQYVSINEQSSELLINNCGVLQGSVLGPLLFLIYINGLPNISKILNFYLFADYTNIYYESNSLQDRANN